MENIWLTMFAGSIGSVGSCDCNSVTSKLMNVLSAWLAAWSEAELMELDDAAELAELVAPVELGELSSFIRATGEMVDAP